MSPIDGPSHTPASLVRAAARRYSARSRRRRAALFNDAVRPAPGARILDLGSEDGSHIASILRGDYDVHIADIDPTALERGHRLYGFTPVLISEDAKLPFADHEFDVVFCSSVIEHATVDKNDLRRYRSTRDFRRAASARQRKLADEIRRVGRAYFVQTPHRYFPVESHTWLPAIVVLLPRTLQIRFIDLLNQRWVKRTAPDFNLLTRRDMAEMFPDADILVERSLGLPKSLIAIRADSMPLTRRRRARRGSPRR